MTLIDMKLKDNSYEIHIQKDSLSSIGQRLTSWYKGSAIAFVTDTNVDRLYGDILIDSLVGAGYRPHKIVVPPGEKSKSLDTLNYIYNKLAEYSIDRSCLIIAFGGGVIGDLTGFAAATFLRGIPYIQLPTTLMAQLDSSIGGKTAINLPAGKNLAGCFYQPKAVYIDPKLLETLPDRVFCDGMAEAVKYSMIKDNELYRLMLEAGDLSTIRLNIEAIITKCCNIKKAVVQEDEHDRNERLILNFGHTIGHGIEKYYEYEEFSHGEAVALGMALITKNSELMGYTEPGTCKALLELLKICKLPADMPALDKERLLSIICRDKKSQDNIIKLVLLSKIGEGYIKPVRKDNIKDFII